MIIYGDQNIQVPRHVHFGKYVLDHMRSAPGDVICLENGITGEKLTYHQATQYAVNIATSLSNLGVKTGDVVAIGSETCLHFMPIIIGVTLTVAAYTPFENGIGRAVLKHKLQLVKPKFFICSPLFWQAYKDVLQSLDCIKSCIAISEIPELQHSLTSMAAVDVDVGSYEPDGINGKDDIALILYSSGTTGMPKRVEITHYSCILTCSPDAFRNKESLKIGFIMGHFLANFYLFMTFKFILLGRTIVFSTDRSMDIVLSIIRKSKIDIIFSNPVHIRAIAVSDIPIGDSFNSVKMIYCRSFHLRAQTIKMIKNRIPQVKDIIQALGLTECGEPTSEIHAPYYKPGSIGTVAPGIFMKVVDPVTRAILGPNEPGEICVKGHTILKRYLDIDTHNYMDEDGFYKTGDLGYFDEEKFFYIIDRLTDIIHHKGYKVSPQEVEAVLLQHPAVSDAGVIGKPDPIVNAVPMAFVVKKPGHDATEKELMDFVAAEVSPVMRLCEVRFIEEIPRNERGKTLRRKLRETLNEIAQIPQVKDIIQALGLTECGEPTSEIHAPYYKPGSIGTVAPGIFMKVVDPVTRAILGPNEPGEICVKGHTILKRYLDIDTHNYMDEDGFYKTGDLGYFDEEKFFYIIDRLTDIIHHKGYKVSPQEVEAVLLQHPAVSDAGVIGKPDPIVNAVPMAFVVKKPGHDATEKELMDFVAAEVSPVMRLCEVRFIEEIPRNERGKTLRRKLRETLNEIAQ